MKIYKLLFFCLSLCSNVFSDPLQFDTSFNQPNGYAYINPGIDTQNSYAYSEGVVLDQDNKIILAGKANNYNQNNVYKTGLALTRYLQNGSLDTSFNSSDTPGYVLTFLDNSDISARSVAIDQNNNIVVVGALNNSYSKLMAARYVSSGQLDMSFSNQGFYTDSSLGAAFGLAIQSDGKIVIIGGEYSTIYVCRLHPNGILDTSFGENGKVIISSSSTTYTSGFGRDIVVLDDGSMVGIGYFGQGSIGKFIVTFKLTSDGVLDNSFGSGGLSTLLLGSGTNCDQIKMDALGKFVIGGTVTNSSTGKNEALVVRYSENGSLDQTFGAGFGYVITPVTNASLYGYGAIVFDRTSENYPGYGIFYLNYYNNNTTVIIKYNYDGSLNTDFTSSGYQTIKQDKGLVITDGLMQLDQKLVIAGRLSINSKDNFLAMRFFNNISPVIQTSNLLLNTQAEGNYGYNNVFISDFLGQSFYAQVIVDQDARYAVLAAIDQVIQSYQTAYAYQPNFNYITNMYLMNPYLLAVQLVLLKNYPDSSAQINSFFALLVQRIKKLA